MNVSWITTAAVHANVCVKIMNTREHVENQDLKFLLLEAAMAHQRIVSFLHHGPGQEKHKVEEDFLSVPPEQAQKTKDWEAWLKMATYLELNPFPTTRKKYEERIVF